jgi:hypothetical protein
MMLRTKALVAALLFLAVIAVPARPAAAAVSCSPIPQLPYKTEIGNTRTYLINWPIYFACDQNIITSTAYGTLTRNGSAYDAKVSQQAPNSWLVLHQHTTVCPPATQAVYRSTISGVVVTLGGAVTVPAVSRSATINCALF